MILSDKYIIKIRAVRAVQWVRMIHPAYLSLLLEELKFDSRSDVIIWMIDNQKNKRNANKMTLTYLIGKQYRARKEKYTSHNAFNQLSQKTDGLNGKNCQLAGQNIANVSNSQDDTSSISIIVTGYSRPAGFSFIFIAE